MKDKRIYVAGHRGMVGSALVRALETEGCRDLLTRTSAELDLRDQAAVNAFFAEEKPEIVVIAAAKVGGIYANSAYPADFLYDNLILQTNLIQAAFTNGVQRLLFLGSTCIYPKLAPQPITEGSLLTGPLEATNEAYAIAKIAGLKLCEMFRRQHGVLFHSAMPTNLYGPGDNYHPEDSHVIPALIRRFHEAKERGDSQVAIWGSGTPLREFLFVDDLAAACLHLMRLDDPPDWVNVGTECEITILDLAKAIASAVGFEGKITTDRSKPDGTPRKLTDSKQIKATGWQPQVSLEEGLLRAYQSFLEDTQAGVVRG
ncbi:MAG: GDP-L-fucose synthase family protein [Opitutales bacterium]